MFDIITTTTTMTAAQAKQWGIADPQNYECAITTSRLYPGEDRRWFKTIYIDVGDGGELVPTVEPWNPPA